MDSNATNPKTQKVLQAEQMFLKIKQGYIDELPTKFDALEDLILLFKQPNTFEQAYTDFCRQVHSMKGSAGVYGINIISTICHKLEDLLSLIDQSTINSHSKFIDVWLDMVDLLRQSCVLYVDGNKDFSVIEKALDNVHAKIYTSNYVALIIDTSKSSAQLCANMLDELGVRVVFMNNGYAALGRLLEEKFDLLVTANEIVGLSGKALIAALKLNSGCNQRIANILITSQREPECTKFIDPDFIIKRDAEFIHNVDNAFKQITQNFADLPPHAVLMR